MAEYLDRKTVDETIMGCTDSYEPPLVDFIVRLIAGKVLSIPTVDVQPVKHGRWKLGKSGNDFIGYPVYNCSVCGYWNEDVYGFLYCPNCGAKMDGEA